VLLLTLLVLFGVGIQGGDGVFGGEIALVAGILLRIGVLCGVLGTSTVVFTGAIFVFEGCDTEGTPILLFVVFDVTGL